jgi:hypothetical protein
MFATEDGPFNIFDRIRFEVSSVGSDWVRSGIHCPLCISFWLGFIGAIFLPWSGVLDYVGLSLALSAVTTFMVMLGGTPSDE